MCTRILILLLGVVLVAACSTTPSAVPTSTPVARIQTLSISDAWIRNSSNGDNSAAYMTITNSGAADTLVTVSGDFATMIELHTVSNDNGMMDMHPAKDGVPIPANGTQMLKPGGFHVMIMGLTKELTQGDTVQLTLTFAHAGNVVVPLRIR